jgi:hypothetical protein
MDTALIIRGFAGFLSVVLLGVIVWRRKKRAASH